MCLKNVRSLRASQSHQIEADFIGVSRHELLNNGDRVDQKVRAFAVVDGPILSAVELVEVASHLHKGIEVKIVVHSMAHIRFGLRGQGLVFHLDQRYHHINGNKLSEFVENVPTSMSEFASRATARSIRSILRV